MRIPRTDLQRRILRWGKAALITTLLLLVAVELTLRGSDAWHRPLFRRDDRYEYMPLPDQEIVHRGIRFATNELGMRSGPVATKKKPRVLVIGDSVINGDGPVTQDSLATFIVERQLGIQVLNCSAPSWGAGNAAAWIAAHGLLHADRVVALFSSHDAFDRMTFTPLVGVHPSYPDHRPSLALATLVQRLRFRFHQQGAPGRTRVFDPGWARMIALCRGNGVPVTVLLHPQLDEVNAERYDDRGRVLLDSLTAWNVAVIPLLDHMRPSMYTDAIHVNNAGQRAIAAVLADAVK